MTLALYSIFLGFSTLLSQIVILREVFSQCGGNEVVYGMGLGFWLLFGGIGAVTGRKSEEPSWRLIDSLQVAVPLFSILSVGLLRGARPIMGVLPGEAPPYSFMVFASAVPLIVPSLAGGMLFGELSKADRVTRVERKSRVFCFEVLGASLGGVVSLVPRLIMTGPFCLLALCLVGSSILISLSRASREERPLPPLLYVALFFVSCIFFLWSGRFDSLSSSWSFGRLHHGYYSQVLGGRFDVTAEGEQESFYLNLNREFVTRDPVFPEEAVHLPSSFSPHPVRFLLVGAGLFPLVAECEKYGDVSVSLLDGDSLHAETIVRELGEEDILDLYIPEDSVGYLRRLQGEYDLIIATQGLPVTLSSLRTLGASFYRDVSRSLAGDGIFYLRLDFGGEYLGEDHMKILGLVHSRLKGAFGSVRIIPGEVFSFLASPSPGTLTSGPDEISLTLRERNIENTYFVPEIIPFRIDPKRKMWADSLVEGIPDDSLWGSLPLVYGLSALFSKQRGRADRLMGDIYRMEPVKVFVAILGLYILFFLATAVSGGPALPGAILFFSGAAGILIEISLIFAYQVAFGSIYTHIGLLFCAYMVGLAAGSSGRIKSLGSAALLMLGGASLSVVLVVWVFKGGSGVPPHLMFYAALFVTGTGGGALFSTAGFLCGSYRRAYSTDLIGSAAAAFTGASILIPLGGVYFSSLTVILLSVTAGSGSLLAKAVK